MNVSVLFAPWSVLFVAFVAVSVIRWSIGQKEDDHLHVLDTDTDLVGVQASVAHKLDVLDRWKKVLLIANVLFALVVAGMHMYSTFLRNAMPVD
jgi:hypothetical protein